MAVPAGQLGFLYYTTLVTQRALGYTPLQTGLALLPFTAGLILTNQLTPRLLPRYGERVVGSTGMVGLVLGAAGMAFALTGPATIAVLLLPSALLGLGAGLTFAPATGVILNQAPPGEVGAAASLTQGLQQLGGALGLAILTTVVTIDNEARSGDLAVAFLATAAFPATALLLFSVWGRRVQPTGQL
jgi:MFS family permease